MKLIGKKLPDSELDDRASMIGTAVESITKDSITVEIFPNRPDMLSEEGFARALRAFIGLEKGARKHSARKSKYRATVSKSLKGLREIVSCCVAKNLKIDDKKLAEIMQFQEKLHTTHSRKRKSASIGFHDLDKISFPIKYEAVDANFAFSPLEIENKMPIKEILENHPKGKEFKHLVPGPKYPIWIDSKNMVIAFPPIINGKDTAVTTKTKNLFIDVTGTDEKIVEQAMNIIATSLADSGADIYSVNVNGKTTPALKIKPIKLEIEYANRLLGFELNGKEISDLLSRMGYGAKSKNEKDVEIIVPCYRTDVLHPFDVVEDIAISYGYENFKETDTGALTIGTESKGAILIRKIAEILVGAGCQETNTNHLMNENDLKKANMVFSKSQLVKTLNSINIEYDTMRPALLPILLKIASENTHNEYPQRIFETGTVVTRNEKPESKASEKLNLGILATHHNAEYSEIRSMLDILMKSLGISYSLKEGHHPTFMPGRISEIMVNGKRIGIVGEIHPQILNNFNIELPSAGLEIDVEELLLLIGKSQ